MIFRATILCGCSYHHRVEKLSFRSNTMKSHNVLRSI
jgi:hypothetical protein